MPGDDGAADLGDAAPVCWRGAEAHAARHVASASEHKRFNLIIREKMESGDYPTGTGCTQVFPAALSADQCMICSADRGASLPFLC